MSDKSVKVAEVVEKTEDWTSKIPIDWDDGELFENTIHLFLTKERFILENDLNERTIVHKLADFLAVSFSKFDVDCEYNRMEGKEPYSESVKRLKRLLELDVNDEVKGLSVNPDIIVHLRGRNKYNYLIIEVKKIDYANSIKDKGKESEETYRHFDKRKLELYIEELDYKWGIYIEFNKSEICQLDFYHKP